MALSKVVLFIVEGETDELALGAPLSRLFSPFSTTEFKFGIVHGDLIADRSSGLRCDPANVKKLIVEQARQYLSKYKLKWSDLEAIVYLTDTDGAFVAASSVIQNDTIERVGYFSDHIESPHASSIVARNENKAACLKVLSHCGHLTYSRQQVAFKACYMSRNLEHALHDKAEPVKTTEKVALSRRFATRFRKDPEAFAQLIVSIAPEGTYPDTWRFIADGNHSLERGSNLSQVLDAVVLSLLAR